MNCMWNSLFVYKKCDNCMQCPIRKYNCCTPSRADADELIYQLDKEIQKFSLIKQKVVDKINE